MFNLRYHIASLVAVFLALAIGLVLGGLVVRQGVFDQQQRALVSSLQSEFNSLKRQNTSLQNSLSLESSYAKQMTDEWVAGRLAGTTTLVATSGDAREGADSVAAATKAAGGSVAIATFKWPDFGLSHSGVVSAVASALGSATPNPTRTDVAKELTAEWTGAVTTRTLTDALVSAGELKLTGLPASKTATLAVDLAAFSGDPDPGGLELIEAYAAAHFFAAGAETYGAGTGVAAAAAARKLSAFDTLGTNPGAFTLVALFTGGQQGYYSDTARGATPFPPVPQP